MPSPFPGMDPYLEGSLWSDVHQALASEIRRRLSRQVRPRYAVRLAIATVEENGPGTGVNLMYPDVEVFRPSQRLPLSGGSTLVAEPVLEVASFVTVRLDSQDRQVTVEIYDLDRNQLVTSIEILSPANKRPPGLEKFVAKRERLRNAGVNLLTIDLIRRGQRSLPSSASPVSETLVQADYLVTLLRGVDYRMQAWPVRLQNPLPVVAVPLRHPDPDVPLDLNGILAAVYDEAGYDLTIDYTAAPPAPSLDDGTAAWLERQLQSARMNN